MMNWAQTALVFPGQGSQVLGMGRDAADAYPAARLLFERADDLLGFALSALCFTGDQVALDDTLNTQPALYVTSLALLAALRAEAPHVDTVPLMAGHSLGEFTALAAAGALAFDDGLRLVRERGRLMKTAGDAAPGAMAAILGLDADAVRVVCAQASDETGGVLVVANDNCPGQIVVSGELAALEHGLTLAKAAGARRAVRLAVSIAAHSPLMESAAEAFNAALDMTDFSPPRATVYGNVSAAPLPHVEAIRAELRAQLVLPVRWTESVRAMIGAGALRFLEIGAKDVLTGLLKRIDEQAVGVAVNSVDAVRAAARS